MQALGSLSLVHYSTFSMWANSTAGLYAYIFLFSTAYRVVQKLAFFIRLNFIRLNFVKY